MKISKEAVKMFADIYAAYKTDTGVEFMLQTEEVDAAMRECLFELASAGFITFRVDHEFVMACLAK